MKTLYLVRHAKSSWDFPELSDKERPLNNRGIKNAPAMAKYLQGKMSCPDIFICSTSQRTRQTAQFFYEVFNPSQNQIVHEEKLYHAYQNDFDEVISRIDNSHQSAMLFAHNPGITDYVNQLTKSYIDNIPTCGVAAINLDMEHWNEIKRARGELIFYYYPKGIKK